MLATLASLAGRFVLAPLASLWRWLTADPVRMAFAVLIALCGFLAWRLSTVDESRDDWRDKTKAYEAASLAVKDTDAAADAEAQDVAHDTKESIDAGNERARAAAGASDDPLRAGLDSLRAEGARKGDQTTR